MCLFFNYIIQGRILIKEMQYVSFIFFLICPTPLIKVSNVIYGWPQRPLASFEASSASRASVTFRPQNAFSLQIHQDGHHGGVGRGRMAATSLSSRPHASVYNVPAFASGLGMTLEPIKTAAAAAGAGATNATTTAVTLEKVSKREIFQDLLPSFASLQGCCPWGCRGCHGTPRFWKIS